MCSEEERVSVKAALQAYRILWPHFIEKHGCVFLGWHSGSNPPPASDTKTSWESFINHTHVLDEFANGATVLSGKVVYNDDATLALHEQIHNEEHPDFFSACELGQRIAKLWTHKLKHDFPNARFRVYYTQYDGPVVRFHRVRDDEEHWLSDDALQGATDPSYRNALIYDTARLNLPSSGLSSSIH